MKKIVSGIMLTFLLMDMLIVAYNASVVIAVMLDFEDSGQDIGNSNTWDIEFVDVDGDGDLDIAEGNRGWDGQPNKIYLNDGSGLFSDSGQNLTSFRTKSVAFGDVDLDGDTDIVFGNEWHPTKLYLNDGSGYFFDSNQDLGTYVTEDVILGDVDGDGDLDLITGNYYGYNIIYKNDGQGLFNEYCRIPVSTNTLSLGLGDLDEDADLDLLIGNRNGPSEVWFNNGTGGYVDSGQYIGFACTFDVALGDLNGDGDLDAILRDAIFFNDGHGNFTISQSISSVWHKLGDIDNDGDLDIVSFTNLPNPTRIYVNNGHGLFTELGKRYGNLLVYNGALGDVDGDGDLDFALARGHGDYGDAPNRIYYNLLVTRVNATVDIIPNTLNLRAKPKYVTSFIELPEGHNVSDIDVSSILLNDTISVDSDAPMAIGDYDDDGIPDLMVKFNGTEVIEYILENINMTELIEKKFMEVTFTVTGKLNDGTPFQGTDTIKLIMPMPRGIGRHIFIL